MEKLIPWFTLKSVPGIGNYLCKRLILRFKHPNFIFQAKDKDLLEIEGMSLRLVSLLKRHQISDQIKKDLDLTLSKGYQIVTYSDTKYPPLLREIPDPPLFLYVAGSLPETSRNLAIVGSRNATAYGLKVAKKLSADMTKNQFTVISGMASGIDTAAHEGALMGKGKTIAVLGSGLEKIYPKQNRKLFHRISEKGAVVSEYPLLTEPEAYHFPVRNRIISGMSLGTVIVEAARKSGSLITARLAMEQNREVFAVPGSIHSFKSIGTHKLIKQGAKLVEQTQDILEELTPAFPVEPFEMKMLNKKKEKVQVHLSTDESKVLNALEAYPVHIDELSRKVLMGSGQLSSILLQLELKGIVAQEPGKRFFLNE